MLGNSKYHSLVAKCICGLCGCFLFVQISAASLSAVSYPSKFSPANSPELLQFSDAGHAIGFAQSKVYFSNSEYLLTIDFVGAVQVNAQDIATDAIPNSKVKYSGLWRGIDLVYQNVNKGLVESIWHVAPHANPNTIALAYNAPVSLSPKGDLNIAFEKGWVSESAPIAWQKIDGQRVAVDVKFKLINSSEQVASVGFELGKYDADHPLLIDPVLEWNTFTGADSSGSSSQTFVTALATDSSGNVYYIGSSDTTWGTPVNPHSGTGQRDGFLTKLNSDGVLQWHTFFGANSFNDPNDVAIDSSGNIIVAGESYLTWGSPINPHQGNPYDGYIAKFDPAGASLWHTFMGGSSQDRSKSVATGANGDIYFSGRSGATWGSPIIAFSAIGRPEYVGKLNASGVLQWNTFTTGAAGVAVDGAGNVFSTGSGYVTKLNSSGVEQFTSNFGATSPVSIALDASGNMYIAGYSATFGSPLNANAGGNDGFLAKLDAAGALQWHTFMGSSDIGGTDGASDVVVDATGVYISGISGGTFGSPFIAYAGGDTDGFVAKYSAAGALDWNTFLGASTRDSAYGVAVSPSGDVYTAGISYDSWASPIVAHRGNGTSKKDGFAAKICQDCFTVSTFAPEGEGAFIPVSTVVESGNTTALDVTAEDGFTTNTVSGCGGTWSGSNPYTTATITADCTVTATFTANVYTVTSDVDINGSLNSNSEMVTHGNVASFTVTPNTGYSTDSDVGGKCPSGDFEGSIYTTGAITSACSVSFTHTISTYNVSASVDANGSLDTTSRRVPHGNSAEFTVTPDTGYMTDSQVSGDCPAGSFSGTLYTIDDITTACAVSFTHTIISYTVTPSAGANGSINPNTPQNVNHGQTTQFTLTPDVGYSAGVAGSCGGSLISNTFTSNTITADCSVDASFAINSYLVSTANARPERGTISPMSENVDHGSTTDFTISPQEGFSVQSVEGCGGTWSGTNPFTTAPITEACTVTVSFGLPSDCDFLVVPSPNGALVVVCL